jgi:magnesium transporter
MQLAFVHAGGISDHPLSELKELLAREDGFVWLDWPEWDDEAERVFDDHFDAHPMVVSTFRQRNHVPTVHAYAEHQLVVLHTPLRGEPGHVHMLELDQVVGRNYIVTVHGPLNPAVDPAEAMRDVESVRQRIERGRFRPESPAELSYALGSSIVRRQRSVISDVAERLPEQEQEVMEGDFRRPEALLERLFLIRHELLTVRTMSAQSHDVYARLASLSRFVADTDRTWAADLAEQFDRVRSVADGESQFLFGVIDLYQTRVTTKMTLAMERLAVIAAITLPVTAIASIYGMNVIVNQRTHITQLLLVLGIMASISTLLLRWTHKQGWW